MFLLGNVAKAGVLKDSISPLPQINKRFLIVAHIALDARGSMNVDTIRIKNSIINLNTYWSKIGVSFQICEFKLIPNYRYDSLFAKPREVELLANFVIPDRINIFYVDSIYEAAGRASVGGINTPRNVAIWLEKQSLGAVVHEMGHYWGLKHTFDNEIPESADHSDCATAGDGVCDTPVDPYIKDLDSNNFYLNTNCVFINTEKDANGNYYDPDAFNVMSYYSCGNCMKFTDGQYRKMVETYYINNSKW